MSADPTDLSASLTELGPVLNQLHALQQSDATRESNRRIAAELSESLEKRRQELENGARHVVFIGRVATGKSAVISALAGLVLGQAPRDAEALAHQAVLPVGGGSTTTCEIWIRASRPTDPGRQGLIVTPLSDEDLRRTFAQVAEEELLSRRSENVDGADDRLDTSANEIRAAILNLVGYAETVEVGRDGNLKRSRRVRPLDAVTPLYSTVETLTDHLLSRARLSERRRTTWWVQEGPDGLGELRALISRINQGLEPAAGLPERMELILPDPALAVEAVAVEHTLSPIIVDTRGLAGRVEARQDLVTWLRDPTALIVLCSTFEDAPNSETREILAMMARDAGLREARERLLVLLLDRGSASMVLGANGSREVGQVIRMDQCWRQLSGAGLTAGLEEDRLLAFDALRDPPAPIRAALVAQIEAGLLRELTALETLLADARLFIDAAPELADALGQDIDRRMASVIHHHALDGAPMSDPIHGLTRALEGCPYALRIKATLRWRGEFKNLHLFNAVETEARAAATAWLDPLSQALLSLIDGLGQEPTMQPAAHLLRERRRQVREGVQRVVDDYGRAVRDEVRALTVGAGVWTIAEAQWSRGPGYRGRVVDDFQRWGRLQPFGAHLSTTAATHIPLLAEIIRPAEAPTLVLTVENLRAVSRLRWELQGINLLIGANGSGKSTALAALRLLNLTYERGISYAVSVAFGGASNLRSWSSSDEHPVLIALERGNSRWELALRPRDGGSGVDCEEQLSYLGAPVFTVDSLGRFMYRGVQRELTGPDCGLRALVAQGVSDLAITQIGGLARHVAAFRVPDVHALKERGSNVQEDRALDSRGVNALTVLRRWQQERALRARYEFVLDGLNLAFPGLVEDIEFRQLDNTLGANLIHPGVEAPSPLAHEADGVVQLLINLVAVASAEPGGVVGLDQPEDHLHPYAIRAFLWHADRWAFEHRLTVILVTHSLVLLNEMGPRPERVFVMKRRPDTDTVPARLTDLYNEDWLQGYALGDLYADDNLGSNAEGG